MNTIYTNISTKIDSFMEYLVKHFSFTDWNLVLNIISYAMENNAFSKEEKAEFIYNMLDRDITIEEICEFI